MERINENLEEINLEPQTPIVAEVNEDMKEVVEEAEKINENLEEINLEPQQPIVEDIFEGMDEEIAEAKKTKPSAQEQLYNMNLQPKLSRLDSWRKKRHAKKITNIERSEKTIKMVQEWRKQKHQDKINNIENEALLKMSGQVIKKDVIKSALVSAGFVLATLCGISAVVATTSTFVACLCGIFITGSSVFSLSEIRQTIKNYKEYRKNNPKKKKEKQNKEKKNSNKKENKKSKKLGLGKKISNFFSKNKKKTDDSNENATVNASVEETPVEIEEDYFEEEQTNEIVTPIYSLNQTDPTGVKVDLSGLNITPGFHMNCMEFVVNKEDEFMQDIIETYVSQMGEDFYTKEEDEKGIVYKVGRR